jgi:signal transduction histidine kinase
VLVLVLVFTAEVAVMTMLPWITQHDMDERARAILDAFLLTLICAPALWWVIISPLRKVALQEQQRSQTIVANASESIVTFESTGVIVSCNPSTSELFEISVENLIGKSMQSLIPDFPLQLGRFPIDVRLIGVRKQNERFPAQVSISEYPSESLPLRIAIIRDLTWSELAEQERIERVRETEALRAQQMATLAQLATGVAHEVRNPLTAIKMLIQVNLASFAKAGLPADDLLLVEQEIRRMERSVNSLLDYARPEKCEFVEFSMQEAIGRCVQLISGRCDSQSVVLSVHAPISPIKLVGDASQIQQLLLNLALNALDAMPSGGKLDLDVVQSDMTVAVSVRDTGRGIDNIMLDRLFTPFVTSKPNGVGLGLGICRRIAESHHGTLDGNNRMSGGAEFTLLLPIPLANSLEPISTSLRNTLEQACKVS